MDRFQCKLFEQPFAGLPSFMEEGKAFLKIKQMGTKDKDCEILSYLSL